MTLHSSLADGIIAVSPALWEVAYICGMNTDMIEFSAVDSDKPLLIKYVMRNHLLIGLKISEIHYSM